MKEDVAIPRGLRNVLIHVSVGGAFPPPPNSEMDVALLRAASFAMRRKAQGITDVCLFLTAGQKQSAAIEQALNAYGFPSAEVAQIECEQREQEPNVDLDELHDDVGDFIARWLEKNHPAAIAYPESGYDRGLFWWIGVEHQEAFVEWPFERADFASELPSAHNAKAETWLTILGNACDLADMQASARDELGQQRAAVTAATLCEWLHGFEAASENGYNHFDPDSAIQSLGVSALFLGFEASRLSECDIDEFCENYDVDIDELGAAALPLLTESRRAELRSALSRFFGNNSSLFWVLHSAIWPRFNRPMDESINALVNAHDWDDLVELGAAWSFVADGWCEKADQ